MPDRRDREWESEFQRQLRAIGVVDPGPAPAAQSAGSAGDPPEDKTMDGGRQALLKVVRAVSAAGGRLAVGAADWDNERLAEYIEERIAAQQRRIDLLEFELKEFRRESETLAANFEYFDAMNRDLQVQQQVQRRLAAAGEARDRYIRRLERIEAAEDGTLHQWQNPDLWPFWLRDWYENSKAFSRDSLALTYIGDHDLCRRTRIDALLTEWFGFTSASAVQRILKRLAERELLDISRPWNSGVGAIKPPDCVRLSPRGQEAYRWLTNDELQPSRYDTLIRAHKSANQVLLVLTLHDLLEAESMQVAILGAKPIMLSGGRQFSPDLVVARDGEPDWYVEVELDTGKNRGQRLAKWRNAHEVGQGHIRVICDKRRTMERIAGELLAVADLRPYTLHLSNAVDLLAGERDAEHGIWLRVERVDRWYRRY